jgi:hypothetical protein
LLKSNRFAGIGLFGAALLLWGCGSVKPSGDGGAGTGGGQAGGASPDGAAGGGGSGLTGGAGGAGGTAGGEIDGGHDANPKPGDGAVDGSQQDAAPVCTPGAVGCDGTTPLSCDQSGSWRRGTPCANNCVNGTCMGVCTPGATNCVGNIPQVCDNQGLWQSATACPYVCRQGQCTGVCVPGSRQCTASGGIPQSCDADGTWQSATACPFVCSQGICTGLCTPGSKTCNGTVPQTCATDGTWQDGTACPYVCSNGACAGSCTPGAHQCSGNVPQTCSTAGTWQSGTTCAYVCSGAGQCTGSCVPGATRCSSGQKQTCDATGTWQNSGTATQQLLVNPSFDLGPGSGWQEISPYEVLWQYTTAQDIMPQSPTYQAWLAGYDSANDDIYQDVAVPAGATNITLSFYYAVFTQEITSGIYDTLDVSYGVNGGAYTLLTEFDDNHPTSTWTRFSTTLPASVAGTTLELDFNAITDSSDITSFYIDTVSLTVDACGN